MSSAPSPVVPAVDPPQAPGGAADRGGHWLGAILALVVSLALYWDTTGHELVYDDLFLISPDLNGSMRPVVEDLGAAFDLFKQEYWENINPERAQELRTRGQALYRPLTVFIWAVAFHFTHGIQPGALFNPADAAVYHWISVIANLLVVLALHRLVLALFRSGRLATLAALVYAVHPLHSEAVAYVAGLSDQLATLTVLAGLLLFERATRGDGLRPLATLGLVATFFTGLLAKESAVVLLAACALTDGMWWLGGRRLGLGRRAVLYGGLLLALAAHVWIRWAVMGYLEPDRSLISRLDNVLITVPTDVRVFNAFKLLAKYVWLVLWPARQSVDYSFQAIEVSESWTDPEPLAGTILIGAMTVVGLARLRRSPALAWGLLFFTGTAVFTSNMFMPIGTVFAERLMYLPTLGAALVLAVALGALLGRQDGRAMNPLALLLVVVALGVGAWRTWERNQDFRSSQTLFESAREVVPRSVRVHAQLGKIYANQGLYSEAQDELRTALAIDSSDIISAMTLGDVQLQDRNFDKAEATFTSILDGMRRQGSDASKVAALESMMLRKRADARRGRGDLAGAQSDLEAALASGVEETPQAARQLAILLHSQERFADSIAVLHRGLQQEPGHLELLRLLAKATIATQDAEGYQDALQRLEATEAGRPMALAMRAEVLYEQASAAGDHAKRDQAAAMFHEAVKGNDRLVTPYVYRGRYLVEAQFAIYDGILEYDKALERDPLNGPALLYKSLAQLQVNDPEGALGTLLQLEKVNPGEACYALLAEAYFKLGDLEGQEEMRKRLKELGKEPLQMTLNRALSYQRGGDPARALEILEPELVSPENAANPLVLRHAGLILLDLGQCADALTQFERQAEALAATPDPTLLADPDPFLDINRVRALTCLDRLDEARAILDGVEASLATLDDQPLLQRNLRASLLQRRAEILLRTGDAAATAQLAAEGIAATSRQHPPFYDLAIQALVAGGDLAGALSRAQEAATLFFKLTHYPLLDQAIRQAQGGDREGAAALLDGFTGQREYRDGPGVCQDVARRLRG